MIFSSLMYLNIYVAGKLLVSEIQNTFFFLFLGGLEAKLLRVECRETGGFDYTEL